MTSRRIVPCIWLDDQAEQAAAFYVETFPNTRVVATSHYPQGKDNPGGRPRGSVLTVELDLAGQRFTLLAGGPMFKPNPSVSFFVQLADAAAVDQLCAKLVAGGKALMPVGSYPWSERYGWIMDRFGVSWQVIAGVRAPTTGATIVPALMFTGAHAGEADAAMRAYTGVFADGKITHVERYAEGEGPVGSVKHGRFVIGGTEMVAMDSHHAHGFGFDEGLSLQVMCDDQAEVDHYWAALGEGGAPGPCGWLKDRFGLSWQVVPSGIAEWMASTDTAARDRAFEAVMGMGKLDIAAIQAAYAGTRAAR